MNQCKYCNGLVPDGLAECPHCSNAGDLSLCQTPGKSLNKFKPALRKITAAGALGLISVTISACYGVPPAQSALCVSQDLDGDGFEQCVYDGPEPERPWYNNYYPSAGYTIDDLSNNDCDDSDPAINPDAADPINDGIDQNCDRADGVYPEAGYEWISKDHYCDTPYAADSDEDGCFVCSGDVPDWAKPSIIANGGAYDCDELNSEINPGAADSSVDGVDQNCDGVDGS